VEDIPIKCHGVKHFLLNAWENVQNPALKIKQKETILDKTLIFFKIKKIVWCSKSGPAKKAALVLFCHSIKKV
jgi:hypothetical protein